MTSIRPVGRRGWRALALAALIGSTLVVLAPSGPAAADAANCDLGTSTVDSSFINSVASAEKAEHRAFENALRATGTYYLCSDFATTPASLPSGAAGTVIRTRPVYPSPAANSFAFRAMYKTTMRDGTVVAATTLIIVPKTGSGPRQMAVWAHPTAGINRTCQQNLDHFTASIGASGEIDRWINGSTTLGVDGNRVVVMPDYIGIGATATPTGSVLPYLARETTGRTIIDAVKATKNLTSVTSAGSDWALLGFSQGGHAAAATAEVFATYGVGSGLDLKGVVAVAGPGDLGQFFTMVNASTHAERGDRQFLAMAIAGIEADRWTTDPSGTGPIITTSTYLTPHANYATTTYLRTTAAPYISPWPWEAAMDNAGEPFGSVNLAGPLLPWNNIGQQATFPSGVYTDLWNGTSPYRAPTDPGGRGPYGSYSIPIAEQRVNSCTDIPRQVYQLFPNNDFLKTPTPTQSARLATILQENSLGYAATSVPTVLIFGQNDTIVPPSTSSTSPEPASSKVWFNRMCGLGDPVRHVVVSGADHGGSITASYNDISTWIDGALDGSTPPTYPGSTGC